MKKLYIFLVASFIASISYGQNPVQELITDRLSRTQAVDQPNLFQLSKSTSKNDLVDPSVLDKFQVLNINKGGIAGMMANSNDALAFTLPVSSALELDLELIKVEITAPEFKMFQSSDQSRYFKYQEGLHYWGRVKGDENSLVTLSLFDQEVTGVINYANQSFSLIKLRDNDVHILFEETNLKDKPTFACYNDEVAGLINAKKEESSKMTNPNNVVGMYIEVDNDLYQDFGSTTATANYIMAVLNQVAILYANESINFEIDELKIWNTTDPYTASSTGNILTQFRNNLNSNFNGDLAHLIGNKGSGGVAYVDVLCGNKSIAIAYSGIQNTFANVPTYSWTVNVITHEIGHNLGSLHTHSCSWNGNNTAIDGCGPAVGANEGCNGPIPSNGGTIMSYCHLTSVGINLLNGFGPQPGDLIRSRVYNGDCLTPSGNTCNDGIQNGNEIGVDCGGTCAPCAPTCTDGIQNGNETGVDCGGDCAACPDVCDGDPEILIRIKLDNYPEETSWELRNDQNQLIGSGGTYGNQADGATLNITGCIPADCYTFIIRDSYGDGICCAYGNGNYEVKVDGETVASGGSFQSSASHSFCIDSSPDPTCNDGVQNGNETGVDCGGDCDPCATCTDGVQNGNETGVDCGGDCSPCPTCTDGIQNGNETGVDCGGDCAPCVDPPTCNDGVQNGDETGIDCGGDCSPCSTCTDGIQNGDETGVDCGGSCDPCDESCVGGEVNIFLEFDNYPEETSWKIVSASGQVVGSGGPYVSKPDGSMLSITGCLPDGCYTFIMEDQYGDGMCCSYGSGSYEVSVDNVVVANGGAFGSSESTDFCIGDFPDTCSDGIQNGDETGVDCGGSCADCSGCTYSVVSSNNFETGFGDWNDGGSDCRRNIQDSQYANSGDYCVRLRDNSSSSVLTSDLFALAGASKVKLNFSFITNSMDNSNEDFWLQVSTNGGSTFQTLKTWSAGIDFNNNSRVNPTVEMTGAFTNSTVFRFRCDASSNTDWVYIDDIVISSCSASNAPLADLQEEEVASSSTIAKETFDINLYPNPADYEINVDYTLEYPSYLHFTIYSISGKQIMTRSIDQVAGKNTFRYDISRLEEGMYHLVIQNEKDIQVKKFVVFHNR